MVKNDKTQWIWEHRWKQIVPIILFGVLVIYDSIRENKVHCIPLSSLFLVVFLLILPPLFGLFYDWKKFRQGEEAGSNMLMGAVYYFIAAFVVLTIIAGICDSITSPPSP